MNRLMGIAVLMVVGGCATQMTIEPKNVGEATAILRLEAPGLAGYVTIPLISSKVVDVTLSEFSGCLDGTSKGAQLSPLGKVTLTPKIRTQSMPVPAGVELAIYAESAENVLGGMYRCGRAVRFKSELGATYVLKFSPHGLMHRKVCQMEILAVQSGTQTPVASAHYTVMHWHGYLKGGDLNLCKDE